MRSALLLMVGAAALVPAVAAAQDDDLLNRARELFEPIPSMVLDVKGNAVTHQRVELGKVLFFDPRLSASHVLSCNTCHNVSMGGDDNIPTSIGHGWQKGPRNAPTVYNAVFNIAQFWDGRAEDLKAQAKGPIQASVEMNNTPAAVVATLKSIPEYVDMFEAAFPGEDDPVTFDNVAKAIEAFEATLITPALRFDQFLKGDTRVLTAEEKEGLRLFIDIGCASCHNGVNLGGNGYHPFGVVEKPGGEVLPENDKGRFAVTETATDEYVFRAAPLRNIALTAPYFHSGQVWDLEQAVAIMAESQFGADVTEEQIEQITAFLKTLNGEMPRIEYPMLPVSTAATPKPR